MRNMNIVAEFPAEEILTLVRKNHPWFQYNNINYGFTSRMQLFSKNPTCVSCKITGIIIRLESHKDEKPHLNLYAVEDGKYILMTKDHIKPKSKGGRNIRKNYQTMCEICNALKSHHDLSTEEVKDLRFNGKITTIEGLGKAVKFLKLDSLRSRRMRLSSCEEAINKSNKPLKTIEQLYVSLHKTGELIADTKVTDIILEKGITLNPLGCNGFNVYVKLPESKFCSINHRYLEVNYDCCQNGIE